MIEIARSSSRKKRKRRSVRATAVQPSPEAHVPFKTAGRFCARPVDASTVYRWAFHGKHGIKLKYWKYGRGLFTSLNAITAFAEAVAVEDQKLRAPVSQP